MKKTLLALAVGAAFAAPAAYADVTISGAINMALEYSNVNEGEDPSNDGNGSVGHFGLSNNYSNVTISSLEDLGGGLKLDFALQIQLAPGNDTSSALANRNSHIGLVSDSWGGVWIGTNEQIYERYLYQIDPADGAAGLAGNLQVMGTPGGQVFGRYGPSTSGYSFYRRDGQSVWYDSPNFGGFTFGVVWQTDWNAEGDLGCDCSPMMFQLGGKYASSAMPLELWAALAYRKDQMGLTQFKGTGGDGSTDTAIQIGAAYTLGDIKLFAGYEMLEYELDGVTAGYEQWERDAFYVGLKWNLASGYLGAQYIMAMEADCDEVATSVGCDDTGANMIGLGYYHTMSKQTQIFVTATWVDNDDNGTYGTAGIGNDNMFIAGTRAYGLGLGFKHTF